MIAMTGAEAVAWVVLTWAVVAVLICLFVYASSPRRGDR